MGWKKAADFLTWRVGGIRHRLLWTGLLFLGVALLINTIAGSLYTRALIKRSAAQLQTEVASKIANQIADIMERKRERLADLAVALNLYDFSSEGQRLLAILLLKNDQAFTGLSVLNDKGDEVVKVSGRRVYLASELSSQSDAQHYQIAMRGDSFVSPVYTTDKAEPYVAMAVPILAGPGRVVGVMVAEVNLTFLWQIIGDAKFSEDGHTYLVDGNGNLIAHQDPSLVLKRTNLRDHFKVRQFLRRPAEKDPNPAEEGVGIMGRRVLSTYAPVRGLGWAVVLTEPGDIALAALATMQRYAILLLAIGLIVGSALIVWVSNKITEPIRALHRGAEIIRQGNLDHRVEIRTGDEIEQLAHEFNEMAGELKNSYSTLEQRVERRTRELGALSDIASTLNQSLDLAPVLQDVIKKMTDIFHFDATRVFLASGPDQIELKASFEGDAKFSVPSGSILNRQGLVGRVIATGESLIFEHIQSDPRYHEWSQLRIAMKSGHSFLAVFPLKAKSKPVGAIVCLGQEGRRLTSDETRLITSMADQIGVAVEKVNLFEETVARANELAALYDVTATVNQTRDPDVMLRDVVGKILQLTEFDAARVYLLDPEGKELRLKMYEGISPEFAAQTNTYRAGEGIDGSVVVTGEPILLQDIQTDPLYQKLARSGRARKAGFRSFMSFPLKSKTNTLGVINFLSRTVRNVLPKDRVLLASMTNQICVAFENANLFEQTVEKAKEIEALFEVTTTVNQSLDLESVLEQVIKKITDIFRFDTTRIYLLDSQTEELNVQASYPMDRKDIERVRVFKRGEGIIGKVVQTREPMIFEDLRNDARYRELSSSKNTQNTGFCFFAAFPITAKLNSVGAITCNGRAPRHLTPGEIQLITSMAGQIGVAVENARLYSETKEKSAQLEQANWEMQEANRAKGDFLAAMSHELRTPLNVIIGNADLCRDGLLGETTEKQKIALEKMLRYSRILLKLINDVLTLTKIEARKMSLDSSTFNVGEVVEHVQTYVEQLNHKNLVAVSWQLPSRLPFVTTDALKLEEILQNLIGNAYKFTPKGSIEIRVRDLNGEGRVEFAVADTGIGIKRDDLEKIFDEFHQLKEAHTGTYSGVGLGLSIVKKYLELMGGDIRVESQPGAGSTFTFTLPYEIESVSSESVSSNKAQAAAL